MEPPANAATTSGACPDTSDLSRRHFDDRLQFQGGTSKSSARATPIAKRINRRKTYVNLIREGQNGYEPEALWKACVNWDYHFLRHQKYTTESTETVAKDRIIQKA